MQVYVQKSTRTTLPRRPSGVSGSELSQPVAPSNEARRPSTGNSAASPARRCASERRRPGRAGGADVVAAPVAPSVVLGSLDMAGLRDGALVALCAGVDVDYRLGVHPWRRSPCVDLAHGGTRP